MSKIVKAAAGLMMVTMLAKVLGFIRELVLASAYGTSAYSDAYLTALNIPNVIFSVIGVGLITTFIPIYYEVFNEYGQKDADIFTNNIFNIVTIICTVIVILGLIFIEPIVKVFAIGFTGNTFELAVDFTRIFIIGIVFIGFSNIMTSYLQIKENFIVPGFITVPCNIIIISSIILSLKYGIYVMAYGTLIGTISQFLFQLPFVLKKGFRFKFYINLKDKYVKKMIILVCPVLIGVAVNQINVMADKTIASTLVEGSISALNYSNRLNLFVTGLFISSISVVIYPMLAKLSTENNKEQFTESIVKSINTIILLVVPISVGAIVLANPIVEILFQRGAFDEKATQMTSIALVFYSIGMVAFGLREILGKIFYSIQDTKTPMINGVISMILNILLNLMLVRYMGHSGLAFATSISAIICIILLFRSLKNKIGYFGQDKIAKTMLKSVIASILMGIITYISYGYINYLLGVGFIYKAISLFSSIGIGAISYFILTLLFKIEEINVIMEMVKRKVENNY